MTAHFKPGDVVVASSKYRSNLVTMSEVNDDGFRSDCCGAVVPVELLEVGAGTVWGKHCVSCGKADATYSRCRTVKRRYLVLSARDTGSPILNQRTGDVIANQSLTLFPLDGNVKQKILHPYAYECEMAEDQSHETRGACAKSLAQRFLRAQQEALEVWGEAQIFHGGVHAEDVPTVTTTAKRVTFAGVTFAVPCRKGNDGRTVPRPALRKILASGKVRVDRCYSHTDDYVFDAATNNGKCNGCTINPDLVERLCGGTYGSLWLDNDGNTISVYFGFESYDVVDVSDADIKAQIESLKKENARMREGRTA